MYRIWSKILKAKSNNSHIKGDEANLSLFLFHKNRNIFIKICSNLKSNTIFELLIKFCVSWNTKKLHLSKYEGNDKHNTKEKIIDKTPLNKKHLQ